MRLLLDQGVPRGAVATLLQRGMEAVHVGDIGMATASDREILEFARSDARVVVTLDADFHALLALSNAATPSVVRVRIEGLRAEPFADLVATVIVRSEADLRAGAMITIDENRVRTRSLPLVRA